MKWNACFPMVSRLTLISVNTDIYLTWISVFIDEHGPFDRSNNFVIFKYCFENKAFRCYILCVVLTSSYLNMHNEINVT